MASAASTYDERLRLVDAFEEYKYYFSKAHFVFLIQESLELNQGGAEKLKYILALASRCKTGVVSIELLAKQIDKEYSLTPLLQEQEGGVDEDQGQEWEDMETVNEDGGDQEDQRKEDEEEKEVPHVSQEVEDLIAQFKLDFGFFSANRWKYTCKPFFRPGEGYWLDKHNIQQFRTSTYEDFASATPKQMPTFIKGNRLQHLASQCAFRAQEKGYHLCKKVAVSFDGRIFRATDAEIEAALKNEYNAPACDAATYVKAAREVCRRRSATARARQSGSG